MLIREARPSDAAELWRLNELFNGEGTNDISSVRRALEHSGDELIAVAADGDSLAGFACGRVLRSVCYPAPTAEVAELYVEEAYRRSGVASALMDALEALFRAAGAAEFHLYTGARNAAAQAFYERMGYSPRSEIMYTKPGV